MTENCLFIFRRDYRIIDNIGLINALKNYKVFPIFIGTPEQLTKKNKYKSNGCVQFIYESLKELQESCPINYFYGDNIKVLKKIIKNNKIHAIAFNEDYTPYARDRDQEIHDFCEKKNIKCIMSMDYMLNGPDKIKTGSGGPYKVYGAYQKKVSKTNINKPITNINIKNFIKTKLKGSLSGVDFMKKYFKDDPNINVHGGRKLALDILKNIKDFKGYSNNRNCLVYNTTNLSAYIKFGCISIREAYWSFIKVDNTLINQLIWRDFYYQLLYNMPDNLFGPMKEKFEDFKWQNNKEYMKKWCEGMTGFPIVDACMRQLNETGYMHNRGRLITSNFLCRILIQNWQLGEQYYANKLVDYDPAVNNGNWQWSFGSGTDTAPFTQRIFNPWLQSEKFDPNCEYIKKYIPELKDVSNEHIHKWNKYCLSYVNFKGVKYPKPIVNYKKQRQKLIDIYKKL